jgi:DNA-binding NtrC family response regulator
MGDTVLVIHHDLETARRIAFWLGEVGYETFIATCRERFVSSEPSVQPTLVIAEARTVEGDLSLLVAVMKELSPQCRVVALVSAELAKQIDIKSEGLDDLLIDPTTQDELLATVSRVLRGWGNENGECPTPSSVRIWTAATSRSLFEQAERLAEHDGTVLLLGESGTGKDHIARWIHQRSARRRGPFFTINCAALSRDLAESELFGHEPGAFTGTKGRKRGLLELADQGTLLLDEIGELEPTLQAKLLTFLDSRTFVRVGGERTVSVAARLLAATNRDLIEEVERGTFRRDLYYRLAVVPLRIPPLRERIEDLPQLADELLEILRRDLSLPYCPRLHETALSMLRTYHWPGNIRELRNVLERALVMSVDGIVRQENLTLLAAPEEWELVIRFPKEGLSLHDITRDVARRMVAEALRRAASKQDAAKLLGISRHALAHQIRVLGLEDSRPSGEFLVPQVGTNSQSRVG